MQQEGNTKCISPFCKFGKAEESNRNGLALFSDVMKLSGSVIADEDGEFEALLKAAISKSAHGPGSVICLRESEAPKAEEPETLLDQLSKAYYENRSLLIDYRREDLYFSVTPASLYHYKQIASPLLRPKLDENAKQYYRGIEVKANATGNAKPVLRNRHFWLLDFYYSKTQHKQYEDEAFLDPARKTYINDVLYTECVEHGFPPICGHTDYEFLGTATYDDITFGEPYQWNESYYF